MKDPQQIKDTRNALQDVKSALYKAAGCMTVMSVQSGEVIDTLDERMTVAYLIDKLTQKYNSWATE